QHTSHQAGWEALLATAAVAMTIAFGRAAWSRSLDTWPAKPFDSPLTLSLSKGERFAQDRSQRSVYAMTIVALTLLLVRQTLEIAVVLGAALMQWRSLAAALAACGAWAVRSYPAPAVPR